MSDDGKIVTFKTDKISKSMNVFYRTADMLEPQITYAEHVNFPDEVACQISFVPTFEPQDPQSAPKVVEDEIPDESDITDFSKMIFTFIIDRSGSMYGSRI